MFCLTILVIQLRVKASFRNRLAGMCEILQHIARRILRVSGQLSDTASAHSVAVLPFTFTQSQDVAQSSDLSNTMDCHEEDTPGKTIQLLILTFQPLFPSRMPMLWPMKRKWSFFSWWKNIFFSENKMKLSSLDPSSELRGLMWRGSPRIMVCVVRLW